MPPSASARSRTATPSARAIIASTSRSPSATGPTRRSRGASRKEHFARLDAETGNFAAALEWAAAQDATAPLLELCAALVIYWFFRQRYAHAVEWIDRALNRPGGDPGLRAHCLITKSPTLWALGRKAEQPPVLEQADALTASAAWHPDPRVRAPDACRP